MRARPVHPVLVELLGVAGSGKSTVTSHLVREGPFERAPFVRAREPAHLLQFVLAFPQTVGLLLANLFHGPRMTWADFKLMVYLTRWRHLLEAPRYSDRTFVLDQGPLYALVRLKARGLGLASTESFHKWWQKRLHDWAPSIDLVVWLDAPDEVVVSRINQRDQSHRVKGVAPDVSLAFVRRYRDLFLDVIKDIQDMDRGPFIRRFDTDAVTPEEITQRVRKALASRRT